MPFIQWTYGITIVIMDIEPATNKENQQFMNLLWIINRKWTILVIVAIGNFNGIRFNALMKELENISPKTLSSTIRELESIGVVESVEQAGPPMRRMYHLTDDGRALLTSIMPALKWIYGRSQSGKPLAIKHALE